MNILRRINNDEGLLDKDNNINFQFFFDHKQTEHIIYFINKNQFVKKMIELLVTGSYTQKDCSIIILCNLSLNRMTSNLLVKPEILDQLLLYMKGYYIKSNKYVE